MSNIRVLIVGTVPFRKDAPSRAFETYFANWDSQSISQIFTNPRPPQQGHCDSFFQITDSMLVYKLIYKRNIVGKVYNSNEMNNEAISQLSGVKDGRIIQLLYKLGSKHTPLTHLLRGVLWRKKLWYTFELKEWLYEFKPDCVFLSFSNDFNILEIAECVSKEFDIPVVFTIGDDYYFDKRFKISPFYYIYKALYRKKVESLFSTHKHGVFISEKMKKKYCEYFGLEGETVYLSSEMKRRPFKKVNETDPLICYFGNILLGRYISIIEIAEELKKINPTYRIKVYSGEVDEKIKRRLASCQNVEFCGAITYEEVIKYTEMSDLVLVVEGFSKDSIESTRYSISTKAADSLQSGANLFAYGSTEAGLIDYLSINDACVVCTEKKQLSHLLNAAIFDHEGQKKYYERSAVLVEKNHNLSLNNDKVVRIISDALDSRSSHRTLTSKSDEVR